jgi:hypothetical protein
MNLTINTAENQVLHFLSNPLLGEAIERHNAGQIERADVPTLREWKEALEKDEFGQPIIPAEMELDIQTFNLSDHPKLEKKIQDYIDQNGEGSVKDLIFNESDYSVSENSEAVATRLSDKEIEDKKQQIAELDNGIVRGVEDLIGILKAKGVLSDADIPESLNEKIIDRELLRDSITGS